MLPTVPPGLSGVNLDAATLLCSRGITVQQVVRVHADSILIVNGHGRACTCWLVTGVDGVKGVVTETGFAAEPAAWAQRRIADIQGSGRPSGTTD